MTPSRAAFSNRSFSALVGLLVLSLPMAAPRPPTSTSARRPASTAPALFRRTSPPPPRGPARTSTRHRPCSRSTPSTSTRSAWAHRCADRRHAVRRAAEHLHRLAGPVHRVRQRAAARDRRKARSANQFRRHRVLRPARPGGVATLRRRLVVDHHHRPAGAPSGSPTATTSATSRWSCRRGRRSPDSASSPPASASASCRAPSRRPTSSTRCTWTRSSSPTTTPSTPA